MISVKLLETNKQIQNKIHKALVSDVNVVLQNSKEKIYKKCKRLVSGWIMSQPEILDLQLNAPNSLSGQFGLYPGQGDSAIQQIINSIESSVTVQLKKLDLKFNGGLEVSFQPSDFSNLLSLNIGHVLYESGDLHWLDWLLNQGDRIIVVGYSYNAGTGLGRSGYGTMQEGGYFRVPPQFSGTSENNFITRALTGTAQEKEIAKIFQDIIGG